MDRKKIVKAVRDILSAIGENPKRVDLLGTPARVADMYEEVLSGIKKDPGRDLEVLLSEDHDEIVLVKDIPLYSICEHHLLPFIGKAHVAYVPKANRVTGLSKLARVVDILAKRLQVQERLTTEIANTIMKKLKPKNHAKKKLRNFLRRKRLSSLSHPCNCTFQRSTVASGKHSNFLVLNLVVQVSAHPLLQYNEGRSANLKEMTCRYWGGKVKLPATKSLSGEPSFDLDLYVPASLPVGPASYSFVQK